MDTNTHSGRSFKKEERQEDVNNKDQGEKCNRIDVNKNESDGFVESQHQTTNNEAVSVDNNVVESAVDRVGLVANNNIRSLVEYLVWYSCNGTEYAATNSDVPQRTTRRGALHSHRLNWSNTEYAVTNTELAPRTERRGALPSHRLYWPDNI